MDARNILKGAYARLKGLERALPVTDAPIPGSLARDYLGIVQSLSSLLGEDLSGFGLPHEAIWGGGGDGEWCYPLEVRGKVLQLSAYLETVYNVGSQVVEIGSLYNSIQDEELKSRCSDLLSAPGNFDRVINQATQVLEDRIRTKSGNTSQLTGVQLVNAVLKSDPGQTVLKVSDDSGEHEGFCHICRGVMQMFRNPTHHHITDKFSREDALKVCAFVDNLLRVLDDAVKVQP